MNEFKQKNHMPFVLKLLELVVCRKEKYEATFTSDVSDCITFAPHA